ncbi:CARDB domain-containing protein [Geobacter sp. SVR]|uniref:CARDB domain-containing protein n=1 Tax=Geobacter sp. SVR TaxID=2495594 RepID=UPI00143EF72F|nr:CARDB domain-containing protein [Geobacter sp. SVR]BCS53259.1 hypothetical protein GSVR_15670 [Geobacter sp. SVR]GCF84645.1 hypothetical protein GSbR_12450 [Geobacter sp. SVR]
MIRLASLGILQYLLRITLIICATVGLSGTGRAVWALSVQWTEQADFETNAVTTGTPTTRVNIDTATTPGDIKIGVTKDFVTTATITYGTSHNKIYTTGVDRTSIAVIDAATNTMIGMIPLQARPAGVIYNSAGNKLYVGQYNENKVSVIDLNSEPPGVYTLTSPIVGNGAYAAAYNPINNKVYIANTGDQTVSILDGVSDSLLATVPVAAGATTASFDSATGKIYLTSMVNQSVTILDGATDQVVKNFEIDPALNLLGGQDPGKVGLRVYAPAKGITGADALRLSWNHDPLGPHQDIQFQVRTAQDIQSLDNATYVGPDGTANSWYVTVAGGSETTVDLNVPYSPAVEIQGKLISDGSGTPVLHEVRLEFIFYADLVVSNVSGPSSAEIGAVVPVSVTVANQGEGTAAPSKLGLFLHNESTGASYLLGEQAIGALASGATAPGTLQVTIPSIPPGNYEFKACADYLMEVMEGPNENNNCSTSPITIQGTDLVVTSASGTVSGGALTYSITVKNQGNLATNKTFYVTIYLSTDDVITTSDSRFNVTPAVYGLAAGASKTLTGTIVIPVRLPVGHYYIGAIVDSNPLPTSNNLVKESDETNNALSSTATQYIYNDLVVTSVEGTFVNGQLQYSATIKNNGNGSMAATNYSFKLSQDQVIEEGDITVKAGQYLVLDGGEEHVISGTTPVSGSLHGPYYIGIIVKPSDTIYEDNPLNNTLVGNQVVIP